MSNNPGLGVAMNIIDTRKLKSPSYVPSIPPDFFKEIGKVAHAWGAFEVLFENFLQALVNATAYTADWRGSNFRKRRKLFKDLMEQALPSCPSAIKDLQTMLDMIEPLYPKRNLVVHGKMAVSMKTFMEGNDQKMIVKLVCQGRYKGVEIREDFTCEELDDLYYEIAHLSGYLSQVSMGHPVSAPASSPEIPALQAFLGSNHPTYPNPSTLRSPPPTSQG